MTDVTDAFAASRAAYQSRCEALALELGLLNTQFATDPGDLIGRQWRSKLEHFDRRITSLTQYLQQRGLEPSRHARYRSYVAATRGWLESEVGRCLNRLVAARAPAELVLERLDFRAPGLSRRLRLITRSSESSSSP